MAVLLLALSDDIALLISSLAMILFASLWFGFWLWMLTDCVKNELPGSREKTTWTVLIVVLGLFGAFAYNVGRRKKRMRELGR